MVLAYKGANRATGVTTDRIGTESYSAKSWVELGRTTLSSAGDSINVASLSTSDYPYMMVLVHGINSGQIQNNMRFNNDSGNNYGNKYSNDGGSDSNFTSQANIVNSDTYTSDVFQLDNVINNNSSQEKLVIGGLVAENVSGAGTAPRRTEYAGKWANTSDSITQVNLINTGSGDFDTGSEVVVIGYDNDEADSGTNYWQELADLELSSAGDTLDTSTITAKKYLWIQAFIPEGAGHHGYIYFNGDDGGSNNNYARRGSINGGSDITTTDDDEINWSHDTNSAKYLNMFVINKSDKEKLCIAEYMDYGSSGAGTAPNRIEWVYKWVNTSAQISSVKLYNNKASSNDFPIGTTLKVWGSD